MDELLTGNNLLASLQHESLKSLRSALGPIELPVGYKCAVKNQKIEDVIFPTRGLIARIVSQDGQASVDAGLYGRDGVSGIAFVFGVDKSPHEETVQVAGRAWRMPVDSAIDVLRRDPAFRGVLLRFAHCLSLQADCSALSNRSAVKRRLSRLLVMCHDRIDGHDLSLTHGFLATTLGVRRASVTSAMHHLEGDRLIKATRGKVQVRDRQRLLAIAGASYGLAEREYERLIGANGVGAADRARG